MAICPRRILNHFNTRFLCHLRYRLFSTAANNVLVKLFCNSFASPLQKKLKLSVSIKVRQPLSKPHGKFVSCRTEIDAFLQQSLCDIFKVFFPSKGKAKRRQQNQFERQRLHVVNLLKDFTIVNYDSRVVLTRELPILQL